MKYIHVKMPDSSVWKVAADLVADNKAFYYASLETGLDKNKRKKSSIYRKEFGSCLKDNDAILDWAVNNMNWDDVNACATLVSTAKVDYQEGWENGEKKVIEEP